MPELFSKPCRDGRTLAIIETGLSDPVFPQEQEFTLQEVCGAAFLPDRPMIDVAGKQTIRYSPLTLPEGDEG